MQFYIITTKSSIYLHIPYYQHAFNFFEMRYIHKLSCPIKYKGIFKNSNLFLNPISIYYNIISKPQPHFHISAKIAQKTAKFARKQGIPDFYIRYAFNKSFTLSTKIRPILFPLYRFSPFIKQSLIPIYKSICGIPAFIFPYFLYTSMYSISHFYCPVCIF